MRRARCWCGGVQRQNAIEGLVGEEVAAAFNGQKSTKRALADAERRINQLLAELEAPAA